ncbi:MAG TPA: GNAT family N-acetyltransferase [Ktedonobacterales bacterium]
MRIREATAEDARGIAEVQVASWQTTYRGLMPESYIASLSIDGRERSLARQLGEPEIATFGYVAEDDSRGTPALIVGFALGGPRREGSADYDGELYAIYLLADTQGHGLGRQLVRAVTQHLAREGITSMLVWVLEANPSRHFYEALGGVLLPERLSFVAAGTPLVEVSYGWRDLASLARE